MVPGIADKGLERLEDVEGRRHEKHHVAQEAAGMPGSIVIVTVALSQVCICGGIASKINKIISMPI